MSVANTTDPLATASGTDSVGSALCLPTMSLWQREMVRFLRQRNRVLSSLLTPLVFWLLLGSGLDRTVQVGGLEAGYMAYFYPGTIVLMLMFSAIFSTISVIEDRREGFLQGVLASPASRLSIVLGKVLGGATVAIGQAVLMLAIWPWIGGWPGWAMMFAAIGVLIILAVYMTALGFCFAWPLDSTAGFHAVMNLVLFPMWFMSGAVFPPEQAPAWMRVIITVNPLTYGQGALRAILQDGPTPFHLGVGWCAAILTVCTAALLVIACRMAGKPRKDGLA